jgi:hypothetical protein
VGGGHHAEDRRQVQGHCGSYNGGNQRAQNRALTKAQTFIFVGIGETQIGETETVSLKDSGTCQFVREGGTRCKRPVDGKQKLYWQYSRGLGTRWGSLTRNQSVMFCLAVLGVVATLILGTIPLLRPDLNKP